MLAPALLGLLVFFVYPLIASVYYSFTRYDLLSPTGVDRAAQLHVPVHRGPERVDTAALNTLWFVVILVPVKHRHRPRGRRAARRARSASGSGARSTTCRPSSRRWPPSSRSSSSSTRHRPGQPDPVLARSASRGRCGSTTRPGQAVAGAPRRLGDGRHHDHLPGRRCSTCRANSTRRPRSTARTRCSRPLRDRARIAPVLCSLVVTGVIARAAVLHRGRGRIGDRVGQGDRRWRWSARRRISGPVAWSHEETGSLFSKLQSADGAGNP